MLPIHHSQSKYSLSGEDNFISRDDLIFLYEKFVFFSYMGQQNFGYCHEMFLAESPYLVIYSVHLDNKYRKMQLCDFDFIKARSLDQLAELFK